MEHYKSWSGLRNKLTDYLCEPLRDRITYFLTRYHKVHNSYGRAVIMLDKEEIIAFSWNEMHRQDFDLSQLYALNGTSYEDGEKQLKPQWDKNCTYCEMDFLKAATAFLNMSIREALNRDNCIIRIFAILDKRVGKKTLQKIKDEIDICELPEWVMRFYKAAF